MRAHARVIVIAALLAPALSACDPADSALGPLVGTTTVTATVTQIRGAAPNPPAEGVNTRTEWTGGPDGTGTFTVGTHSRDGLAPIPEGRYEVRTAPGAREGDWMLCNTALCGPAFPDNATVVGRAIAPYSAAVYIGRSAQTLWIDKVILTSSSVGGSANAVP